MSPNAYMSTSPAQVRTQLYHRLAGMRKVAQQAQQEAVYLGLGTLEEDLGELQLWLHGVAVQIGLCKRPSRLKPDRLRAGVQTQMELP